MLQIITRTGDSAENDDAGRALHFPVTAGVLGLEGAEGFRNVWIDLEQSDNVRIRVANHLLDFIERVVVMPDVPA